MTQSLAGAERGGGRGRPRNWRSAKVAGAGIGFPALLDLCLQQRWHLAYVWSAFAAVDTRFYTKLNGRGGKGGGGRPRHRLSAKIASIDSIIANLKNDKRVQAKSSVVGADSKRKGNARLIVAELDTKLGGAEGGGRPRNWRSAKVAGASIVIARLRQEKRYHGRVR